MGNEEMARLSEHAKANPEFLEKFRQDPVSTAREAGFTVERHESVAMEAEDFSVLSDEEVIDRISKFWMIEGRPEAE